MHRRPRAHVNNVPSFAKISEQIFDYTRNITICWKMLLTSRVNCPKTKLLAEGKIQITWVHCAVINMFCTGIITLSLTKLVMYFVMSFCQNASSFIERVRNSIFEMLSSRTAPEHPKVLLCPSIALSRSCPAQTRKIITSHERFVSLEGCLLKMKVWNWPWWPRLHSVVYSFCHIE